MDHIKNLDSCKYVMSLDTLDLALLPNYSSRFIKPKAPLWTANNWNFNTTDYFEFEIKPKSETTVLEDDNSKSNDDTNYQSDLNHLSGVSTPITIPKEIELTTCNICDLDVPTAYIDDHEDSLKHKAYLKIANVVLERTRRHMLRKSNRYGQKNNSTFFCGPCTSVVLVVDRADHEKSKAHKRSVSLDRLLYELVDLYTHEEHDYHDESSSDNNKSVDDNRDKTRVNETVDNKVVISDIKARLDELETKTNESYIRMIDEFDEDKVYVLSTVGNDLKISTDDYDIIVSQDNFNGFLRIDSNFILCMVCKLVLAEEKGHKHSDAHIRNVATPFKDHHCIRNLDHVNHCVICNKTVENADLHILCDNTHSELLNKALINKKTKETKQKYTVEESIQCSNASVEKIQPIVDKSKELNVSVDKQTSRLNHVVVKNKIEANKPDNSEKIENNVPNGNVPNSDSGDTNGNRLLKSITVAATKANPIAVIPSDNDMCLCPVCNIEIHVNNVESHVNGSKHAFNSKSEVHYIMQDVGSVNLLCRVCNIYTADDVNEIRAHVITTDHVSKYKAMLHKNYLIKKKSSFYCKPCDTFVLNKNEFCHMEKIKHGINLVSLKEPVTTNPKAVNEPSNLKLSDKIPPPSKLQPSDKVPPPSNLQPSDKVPSPSNLQPSDKIPSHFCGVCQVYIPNNPYNITTHNDGMRHKKNASKIEVAESETNSSIESSTIHYHMEATDNEKTLTCKVCKVAIPNIDDSITEHIVGKKHESNFKGMINANYMVCVEGGYFCSVCKYSVNTPNIFKHINDVAHQKFISLNQLPEVQINKESKEETESQSQANTSIDQSDTNTKNTDTNTDFRDKYVTFKHHFTEIEDKLWLQCKVCFDMEILNTEEAVANHIVIKKHKHGYKNLLADNLILEMDRGYFCAICVCLVPVNGEVHHAKGIRHTGNYNSAMSKTDCDLCNLTPINMFKHILSDQHLANVMKNQPLVHYCVYCKVMMPKDKATEHPNTCHKFAVKEKICFCKVCDPYLPSTSRGSFH